MSNERKKIVAEESEVFDLIGELLCVLDGYGSAEVLTAIGLLACHAVSAAGVESSVMAERIGLTSSDLETGHMPAMLEQGECGKLHVTDRAREDFHLLREPCDAEATNAPGGVS